MKKKTKDSTMKWHLTNNIKEEEKNTSQQQ